MRKLFSVLFIFFSIAGQAQTPQFLGSTNTNLIIQALMTFDSTKSTINLQLYDTTTTKTIFPTRLQYRLARESNGRLYQYIGTGFTLFDNVTGGGAGADSNTFYTKYRSDTSRTNIYAAIAASGGTPDSSRYQTVYRTDTAKANLRTEIGARVKYTDTAAMLSPYLRSASAAATYVPYTGATGNVNLGTYNLIADAVQFNTSPSVTPVQGLTYWDAAEFTLATTMDVANGVTLQIGQENYVRAVNKTGVTITDGQVVYINGAQGNRPTIRLGKADSVLQSTVIGVATQNIANNLEGFVTTTGVVNGYNTTGFAAGDELFLSPTTAGLLTNTVPTTPNNTVPVAIALNSTVNGSIYVHPQYPLSADTNSLMNSDRIAPTQKAMKSLVNARVKYTDTTATIATKANLKDTAAKIRLDMLPAEYQSYIKYLNSKGMNLYGKTIYVYGDSYTMGTGASSPAMGFIKYLESWYGCTFVLIGADGATISKRSPVITSSTNFVDAMVSLPTKNANNPFLWVMAGVNDYGVNNASGTWILSNYITDYTTGLNTANSKGYQNQDIFVVSPWWIPFQGRNYYNTIFGTGIPSTAHCDSFAAATEALMTSRNIPYINMYGMMKYGDTNTFVFNHPNDRGHWDIARAINATLGSYPISFSTQTSSTANIVYNTVVNLTNTGTTWTAVSGSGGYGTAYGISNQSVPANSNFRMTIDGTTAFSWAGVKDVNAIGTGYATSKVAIAIAAGDVYYSVNGSSPAPTGAIASTDTAILERNDSVYTVKKKTAAGVETTLLTVAGYNSKAIQYLTADVGAGLPSAALVNPKITIFGAYPTGDNEEAIEWSKGNFKGYNQDASKLRFKPSTGILTISGNVTLEGVPEYADNAAAVSAGLPVGRQYRTGDTLKIVH